MEKPKFKSRLHTPGFCSGGTRGRWVCHGNKAHGAPSARDSHLKPRQAPGAGLRPELAPSWEPSRWPPRGRNPEGLQSPRPLAARQRLPGVDTNSWALGGAARFVYFPH